MLNTWPSFKVFRAGRFSGYTEASSMTFFSLKSFRASDITWATFCKKNASGSTWDEISSKAFFPPNSQRSSETFSEMSSEEKVKQQFQFKNLGRCDPVAADEEPFGRTWKSAMVPGPASLGRFPRTSQMACFLLKPSKCHNCFAHYSAWKRERQRERGRSIKRERMCVFVLVYAWVCVHVPVTETESKQVRYHTIRNTGDWQEK